MFVKVLLYRLGNVIGYGDTEVNLVCLQRNLFTPFGKGQKRIWEAEFYANRTKKGEAE